MDITIFGTLFVSLTGTAVFFSVVALGAVGYLALTGTRALAPNAGRLWIPIAAGSGLASVMGLFILRVLDGGAVAWLATLLLAGASGAAVGGSATLLATVVARTQRTLAAREKERRSLAARAAQSARLGEAAQRARLAAGDDIREQTQQAAGALGDLRAALAKLESARKDLDEESPASPERERLAQDLTARIDLGRRALGEAAAAVERLRANEHLRVLVRRRPQAALDALSSAARGGGNLAEAAAAAEPALAGFLQEIRVALDACDEDAGDARARVREELEAMVTAYTPVLGRLRVLKVRLAADAGTAEVASATSAVSERTRKAGLDQTDVDALAVEVSRADQALAITLQDADARELKNAVERGAVALAKNDDASLSELLGAMREIG